MWLMSTLSPLLIRAEPQPHEQWQREAAGSGGDVASVDLAAPEHDPCPDGPGRRGRHG